MEKRLIGNVKTASHIPHLETISEFYSQLKIGKPQGNDFSIMRIEDQPDTKRMEMPLFRGSFYRLVFLEDSMVKWELPNDRFESSQNCIYFAYPGKLESWQTPRKNKGVLVCFTSAFAHIDALTSSFDEHYPFFTFDAQSLLPLTHQEADKIKNLLEPMLEEMGGGAEDANEMLRHQLHQYLITIKRFYLKRIEQLPSKVKSNVSTYNKFKRVVDDYFAELASETTDIQASVSLIADRLNLNPSYLNTLIKRLTGKTASHYIHEKTILEAKSYLMHTDLQITEISYLLGFAHVSYFNRFFKKITDRTPLGFRKKQS